MSSLLRLRQRLETIERQLELVELNIEELRFETAQMDLSAALMAVKELLGSTSNCNCLEYGFPHKRGQGCPPVLPWSE